MPRIAALDILIELSELCHDITGDIQQQLNYYRASVYKNETAGTIKNRVEQLRLVSMLINDDGLLEAFRDHDALVDAGPNACIPGECSLSTRTLKLTHTLDLQLRHLQKQAEHRNTLSNLPLTQNVHKHRQALLSLCRHGSRQWSFFQAL